MSSSNSFDNVNQILHRYGQDPLAGNGESQAQVQVATQSQSDKTLSLGPDWTPDDWRFESQPSHEETKANAAK